jgi:hypothetical protein
MKVFLHETGRANLPELQAYSDAFTLAGHEVEVLKPEADLHKIGSADVVLRFGGLLHGSRRIKATEVHEYHSASTGRFPRLKNVIKALADGRPSGRVFLSDWVRRQYPFPFETPYVTRDMGANPQLLSCRESTIMEFDVVYGGSISGRPGLLEAIAQLSRLGARVGVAGGGDARDVAAIEALAGIRYAGMLTPPEMVDFLARGRFGLNFCPDRYPWNQQTSTKVVEYLVAGRPIISNSYPWIREHSRANRYTFLPLEQLPSLDDWVEPDKGTISRALAEDHLWPNVIRRSGLVEMVEGLIQ